MEAIRLFEGRTGDHVVGRQFAQVRDLPAYEPARRLMERVFEAWPTRRAEFARDFCTRGFSARVWELALFAYFSERDYALDMSKAFPDFLVSRDGAIVAVEATTTNPPKEAEGFNAQALADYPHVPEDVLESETELIFQLGKALRRKVLRRDAEGRRYWESDHISGRPFVIAIEAFHGETSLFQGDSGLAAYLYGLRWTGSKDSVGRATFSSHVVTEHRRNAKVISSGFFFQPDMENVSGIIFSNAGTISQFERIGIEHGLGNSDVRVFRKGTCYDHDPNALDPATFGYQVEPDKHRETFATGMRFFHNPRARFPVPRGFFQDVVEMRLRSDHLVESMQPAFAPFASATFILAVGPVPNGNA